MKNKHTLKGWALCAAVAAASICGGAPTAFASSYAFTCADVDFTEGGTTCSSGVITVPGSDSDLEFKASSYSLTNGTLYYVYATAATGGGTLSIGGYKRGSGFAWVNHAWDPSSTVHTSFTTTGPSGSDLSIANTSSVPNTFAGTYGPVCISDVSDADAQAACGVTPPAAGTAAATTTVDTVANTLSTGFYIFFIAFFGVVWLFRKRN